MREKEYFREQLALINDIAPGKLTFTVPEVAKLLGVDVRTVRALIERKNNPLPAQNVGRGSKYKTYLIPKTALASFTAGERK